MTEPLPDPNNPKSILPHEPQDNRDIWDIHAELPPLPYVEDVDELRRQVHGGTP